MRCNSSAMFCLASLLDDATVISKSVRAKVYQQDPFDPVSFIEDKEKCVVVNDMSRPMVLHVFSA